MKRALLPLLLAGLAGVLLSCAQQPNLTVSLGETSLTLTRGASGTVTVSVTGGAGPVDLSVSGLPEDVTASFSPEEIASGNGSSTMTIDVSEAAATGSDELTVTATAGGRQATSTLELVVEDLEVSGTVIDLLGAPMAGMDVTIGDTTETTDADGNFTIGGLSVPYDLIVHSSTSAHVFEGLTTDSPTVLPLAGVGTGGHPQATIEGDLPVGVPAGQEARVCVEALTGEAYGCTTVAEAATFYSINAILPEGGEADVRLHAIAIETDADGLPTGFGFYGTATGSITAGGAAVTIDIPSVDDTIASETVDITVAAPAGIPLNLANGSVNLSDDFALPIFGANPASASFSVEVPSIGQASYQLVVQAASAGNEAISVAWIPNAEGGTSVNIELSNPPSILAPASGATGVGTDTEFRVSGTNDRVVTFVWQGFDLGSPDFAVTTTDTTETIPDLSALDAGLALPSSVDYNFGAYTSPEGPSDPNEAAVRWIGHYGEVAVALQYGGPAPEAGSIVVNSFEVTTD